MARGWQIEGLIQWERSTEADKGSSIDLQWAPCGIDGTCQNISCINWRGEERERSVARNEPLEMGNSRKKQNEAFSAFTVRRPLLERQMGLCCIVKYKYGHKHVNDLNRNEGRCNHHWWWCRAGGGADAATVPNGATPNWSSDNRQTHTYSATVAQRRIIITMCHWAEMMPHH